MKALCLSVLASLCAAPALASVTVSSPANGSTVTSPFAFAAVASPCSSQSIASMGYSLDNSSNTVVASGTAMTASVSSATGAHVLHVKSWGNKGASCTANVTINVIQGSSTPTTTNVAVSSPVSGASVTSPLVVAASGTLCLGQTISAFGYSLDGSASTTIVSGTTVNASVSADGGSSHAAREVVGRERVLVREPYSVHGDGPHFSAFHSSQRGDDQGPAEPRRVDRRA